MKLKCGRQALANALTLCASIIPSRSPVPEIFGVKLVAADRRLRVIGSDFECYFGVDVDAVDVFADGTALVSAADLKAIVTAESGETIDLETSGPDDLRVASETAAFKLRGMDEKKYPTEPKPTDAAPVKVNFGRLMHAVRRVSPAISKTSSRYAINGILFRFKKNGMEVVACDGSRLGLAKIAGKFPDGQWLLTGKAASLLGRIEHDDDDQASMTCRDDGRVFITVGGVCLSVTTIEGVFPPYESIIPKDQPRRFVMSSALMVDALRRADILKTENSKGVRFVFESERKRLRLERTEAERGDVEIAVPIEEATGGDLSIMFNPSYVRDGIGAEDKFGFELGGSADKAASLVVPDFMYIVMPSGLAR